jgi:hypothetical protein
VPHQANARMRSCVQAESRKTPRRSVMAAPLMMSVVTSRAMGAFASAASMTMDPYSLLWSVHTTVMRAVVHSLLAAFAASCANAAFCDEKRRKE